MNETVIAIYGSHNANISLSINGEIKEVLEIERLVGKKNAALWFYYPTAVKDPEATLKWIADYFSNKYGITEYDICYYDVVALEMVQQIFHAKKYIATSHHVNHAYSTFYQSSHKEALVLSFDGGGNDGWFLVFHMIRGNEPIQLLNAPVNLGVCYSMVGHYLKELKHEKEFLIGNLVYSGKLMGLAGYGTVRHEWLDEFDAWYSLPTGVPHISLMSDMLTRLGIPLDENQLASSEDSKDLAATNQYALEKHVLKWLQPYLDDHPNIPVHITGGGGLNILLNTLLSKTREVFVSPNPNDCGLSVGMLCGHLKPEIPVDITYAGPEVFDENCLLDFLESYETTTDMNIIAQELENGKIIGVVRNRCEHGPRALGNRSILCNPTIEQMKDTLNAKVKHREWYRPFAPVVRLEDVSEYFEWNRESRWMNYCPKVKEQYKTKLAAITHVDGTARVQTVTREQNSWLYDLLTIFKKRTGIGVLLNTSFNLDGKPILNSYKDAMYVFNNSEMDGLVLQDTYISKTGIPDLIIPKNKDNKLTVVTGLWDIDRPGRSFDEYIEQFEKLLDVDCNLFIHIQAKYEHIVWRKRQKHNTFVKIYELEDIKEMYGSFWEPTQRIRTDPAWYNSTGESGWLATSPQATLEWYNPIVMSKFSMLHNVTSWNPFDSEYFIWVDAGITFTVYEKYFTEQNVFDKMIPYLDSILFLSYPYQATDEIHGFNFKAMNDFAGQRVNYVCRGGLFGGSKEAIRSANGSYWHLLNNTLRRGYMGTEECIFTILSYVEPEVYRRYALDENGLIVKFTQALVDGSVQLEPIPIDRLQFKPISQKQIDNVVTNKYVLTFNFPEQLEAILTNFAQIGWDQKTQKTYVLDNSTKPESAISNKEIATRFNAEYISMGENRGINGGRFFAAQHFDQSDADYYIFFEDDMMLHTKEQFGLICRNGFQLYVPDLYEKLIGIMSKENFDFLKLSFTEVYMDNNIQVSWYNVPQVTRTEVWPEYDQLPVNGLDPNCPRTKFDRIDQYRDLAYITGQIYYANWPMIMGKSGNKKVFLDTTWARPYEQTWMSYVFMETLKGNIRPAVLLASPVNHNRIAHYTPEERREN